MGCVNSGVSLERSKVKKLCVCVCVNILQQDELFFTSLLQARPPELPREACPLLRKTVQMPSNGKRERERAVLCGLIRATCQQLIIDNCMSVRFHELSHLALSSLPARTVLVSFQHRKE